MRARIARRAAERDIRNAEACGVAPTEWQALTRSERKKLKRKAKRRRRSE